MSCRQKTALLSLCLGIVGAQHFYLKRYIPGVLCVVFSFTLIPAFFGILEFCLLVSMSDADYEHYIDRANQEQKEDMAA